MIPTTRISSRYPLPSPLFFFLTPPLHPLLPPPLPFPHPFPPFLLSLPFLFFPPPSSLQVRTDGNSMYQAKSFLESKGLQNLVADTVYTPQRLVSFDDTETRDQFAKVLATLEGMSSPPPPPPPPRILFPFLFPLLLSLHHCLLRFIVLFSLFILGHYTVIREIRFIYSLLFSLLSLSVVCFLFLSPSPFQLTLSRPR